MGREWDSGLFGREAMSRLFVQDREQGDAKRYASVQLVNLAERAAPDVLSESVCGAVGHVQPGHASEHRVMTPDQRDERCLVAIA